MYHEKASLSPLFPISDPPPSPLCPPAGPVSTTHTHSMRHAHTAVVVCKPRKATLERNISFLRRNADRSDRYPRCRRSTPHKTISTAARKMQKQPSKNYDAKTCLAVTPDTAYSSSTPVHDNPAAKSTRSARFDKFIQEYTSTTRRPRPNLPATVK